MDDIYLLDNFEFANKCDTINPLNVNVAGHVKLDEGIKSNQYRFDYYMFYVLEGSVILSNDNIKTILRKGQFVILSPFTRSSYHSPENKHIDYLCLHFTGVDAENLLKNVKLKTNTVYTIGVREGLVAYWDRFFREFIKNDEFFTLSVSALLTSLLIIMSRYTIKDNIDPLSMNSIAFINAHLNADLKIDTLAKMEGLSESHYRVVFKKTTGQSPNNYITNKRMEVASKFLLDTNMPLLEIANAVGYDNLYYFERVFKKKFGIPPGKFRKSVL